MVLLGMLSEKTVEKIKKTMTCYPDKGSACMSAIRIAQLDDPENQLTEDTMRQIADMLDLPPIKVH
ncbi:MAG: NAD(P)H-dependent oxidoreductase subunit E, partial [Thermodesulfobacteriota bacterium]